MAKRLEITVSQETWDALEAARGHEPRASFVKRALENALSEKPSKHIPGFGSVPADVDAEKLVAEMERKVPRPKQQASGLPKIAPRHWAP